MSFIELFNLLINPESHEFALRWHRDDVKETAAEDEERESLSIWHHGVRSQNTLLQFLNLTIPVIRFSGTRRCIDKA